MQKNLYLKQWYPYFAQRFEINILLRKITLDLHKVITKKFLIIDHLITYLIIFSY